MARPRRQTAQASESFMVIAMVRPNTTQFYSMSRETVECSLERVGSTDIQIHWPLLNDDQTTGGLPASQD